MSTYPQLNLNEHETYRKGNRLVVVHERKDGEVFYHSQDINEDFVSMARWKRVDEKTFDAFVVSIGAEKVTQDE